MASGNTLEVFAVMDNVAPAAAFASIDTRNGHPVLDFDAATDESAIFPSILPRHYGGGGVTARLIWGATSATSGNVVWNVAIERIADAGQDIDSDGFASAQAATVAAPATSGVQKYTDIAFTSGAQMDSLVAGEAYRLKVTRLGTNGSDTMTGDAELWGVELRES